MCLADHRHGLEVKIIEGLSGRQPSFGEMAFEPAAAALGHLMFGQGGQETCRRPALLVGLGGERGLELYDGGQPQLGEVQLDTGGVGGMGRSHNASTCWTVLSSS